MPDDVLPLFAAAQARELAQEADARLPAMPLAEHVATDYQTTRLSLKGHTMTFLRPTFRGEGVLNCAEISTAENGARVRSARSEELTSELQSLMRISNSVFCLKKKKT